MSSPTRRSACSRTSTCGEWHSRGLGPAVAGPDPRCPAVPRCRAYNTVAVAVPKEPVLYEFGGELIDRAAWPGGEPPDLPAVKARKRLKEKRKKGKGLKKSPSGFGELSRAESVTPTPPSSGGQGSRKRRRKERNRKKRLKSNAEAV